MAVVQSTYSENIAPAVAGMVGNMTNWDADTLICETEAGIPFGRAVGQGTAANGGVIGASAATGFRGVSIRDVTLPATNEDVFLAGDNMAVLTEGDIWVTVGGDVTAGQDVTFVATTGILSSAATSGSQFAVTGARWMTSASNGGLALLRLSGHVPAAS